MIELNFERSTPKTAEEGCSDFKYYCYLILGYPFYVLQSMLSFGDEAEKSWLQYKCD